MANFRSIWFSMAQKQRTNGFGAKSKQNKKKKLKHTPLFVNSDRFAATKKYIQD